MIGQGDRVRRVKVRIESRSRVERSAEVKHAETFKVNAVGDGSVVRGGVGSSCGLVRFGTTLAGVGSGPVGGNRTLANGTVVVGDSALHSGPVVLAINGLNLLAPAGIRQFATEGRGRRATFVTGFAAARVVGRLLDILLWARVSPVASFATVAALVVRLNTHLNQGKGTEQGLGISSEGVKDGWVNGRSVGAKTVGTTAVGTCASRRPFSVIIELLPFVLGNTTNVTEGEVLLANVRLSRFLVHVADATKSSIQFTLKVKERVAVLHDVDVIVSTSPFKKTVEHDLSETVLVHLVILEFGGDAEKVRGHVLDILVRVLGDADGLQVPFEIVIFGMRTGLKAVNEHEPMGNKAGIGVSAVLDFLGQVGLKAVKKPASGRIIIGLVIQIVVGRAKHLSCRDGGGKIKLGVMVNDTDRLGRISGVDQVGDGVESCAGKVLMDILDEDLKVAFHPKFCLKSLLTVLHTLLGRSRGVRAVLVGILRFRCSGAVEAGPIRLGLATSPSAVVSGACLDKASHLWRLGEKGSAGSGHSNAGSGHSGLGTSWHRRRSWGRACSRGARHGLIRVVCAKG